MELTTLHVDTVMSQDGGPASGISPTESSPDDALATVGYVKSKVLGLDNVDVNVSTLQSKLSQLDTQLTNIETSALTRAQYGALKDELMADINRIAAAGDASAGQALTNLQQQLQQANANITTLNQRNATLNANIKSLQLEKANLENRIATLENQLAIAGGDSEQLKIYINRANAAEAEAARLRTQVGELNTQIAESNAMVESLRTQVQQSNTQISELNATIESLRAQIAQPGTPEPEVPPKDPEPEPDNNSGGHTSVGGIEFVDSNGSADQTQPPASAPEPPRTETSQPTTTPEVGGGGGPTTPGQTTVGKIEFI